MQHSQDRDTGFYKILSADDSTFKVIEVTTNFDEMENFNTILTEHQLFDLKGNLAMPLKILSLLSSCFKCELLFYVILRGQWVNLIIERGDLVQIFGKFSKETRTLVVTDYKLDDGCFFDLNFVVVEPSLLLTPTAITASFPCYRRVILQSIFRQRDDVSLAMTVGTMMHELWESMVARPDEMSIQKAEELIDCLLKDQIEVLYFLKANLETLRQDMQRFVPFIKEWTDKHVGIPDIIFN